MPGFSRFIDGNCEVSCGPKGFRRILRFIPYYDGTSIDLILNIRNLKKEKIEISYHWVLWRWDGQTEHLVDGIIDPVRITCKPGNNKQTIKLAYLAIPDKHYVKFSLFEGPLTLKDDRILADFTLLSRDQYVPNIVMWITGPIMGAGLTLLVQFILRAMAE